MNSNHNRLHRGALISALVAFVLLAGCNTIQVGSDFDLKDFESRVERSVTTQDQVKNWLGTPGSTGVVVDRAGRRLQKWTYFFGTGQVSGKKPAKLKYLEVHFDQDGKVVAYNWSE